MNSKPFCRAARSKSGRRYRPSRLGRFTGKLLISVVLALAIVTDR